MYEMIQTAGNTYYFESPAKIGLYRMNETDVCLIDSGNDKDAGKKVLRQITAMGWRLTAIFNTHSHADHIGGNRYLQAQTGCKIYAPGIERDFTCHPVLEPSLLYGGNPPKALRHKFLMAQDSDAEPLMPQTLPQGMEALPLPGHCFDMVGFRTPDDVVFLADCLSSAQTLDKYQVGFLMDPQAYIATLEAVSRLRAKLFVPSHAEPAEDIAPLAALNIRKVQEIAEQIVSACAQPIGFDELLARVFRTYGLVMTLEQHALVGSTVRSYLAWLADTGRLETQLLDNHLLWHAV